MERFGGFIRLTAHQLVSAKPTVGVCLTAQKSYKSGQIEQIEQIDNDKKYLEDLERFVEFLGEADCRSVPHNSHPNPTLTGGPPDNTQLYV